MKFYGLINSLTKINKNLLETKLRKSFENIEIFYSNYAGHIENIVKNIIKESLFSPITLVVIGGDGTLNEVCNGIAKSNHKDVFLGYIPGGTANVVAKEFFIPENIDKSIEIIKNNNWREINLSRAGDKYFIFSCGIGFDGEIVSNVNFKIKEKFGKFAFVLSGFNTLKKQTFSKFKVILDGDDFICSSIIASRIRRYAGNFELFKNAYILSDYFEVAVFDNVNFKEILKFFLGKKDRNDFKIVKKITIPEDYSIKVQIDGEILKKFPKTIEVSDKKIKFILP